MAAGPPATAPGAAPGAAPGRPGALAELALGLAVFAVYSVVAGVRLPGHEARARRHAGSLYALEQRLHLDVERPLNAWLAPHDVLRVLADYEYATTYVLSAFLLLWWLWRRRPDVYRWARTSFVLLNLGGVACFALWPLLPPRLLPASYGFVDTVREGRTWGSWGSPLVGHANQLAAMPSLHLGWALWVSVVLARVHGGVRTQLVSAVHVLLTLWVVLATANHYLLDAVAAAVLVALCVRLAGRGPGHERGGQERVAPADAFFLHVERDDAPQLVGGVVLLDTSGRPGGEPTHEEAVALARGALAGLPRFRSVVVPATRWRRARWRLLPAEQVDWAAHVPDVDLRDDRGRAGGLAAFERYVAQVAGERLPLDRPPWRLALVRGVEPGVTGVLLVVHHAVADGIGTVAQALSLLEPPYAPPAPTAGPPGPLRTALGTVVGVAQLARDGTAPSALPSSGTPARSFGAVDLPLEEVRATARAHGVRVSDVLLSLVATALRRSLVGAGHAVPDLLRVSVPLTLRDPRAAAEGNVTAAVLLDLPLGELAPAERLREVARRSAPLRSPTRAVASRTVMRAAGTLLPPVLHAAFARSVYGPSRFSAVVSNMPGPDVQLSMLGAPLLAAYPLLPLAPDVPVVVGALGWSGSLCAGVVTDPAAVPDAAGLASGLAAALAELRTEPVSAAAAPAPRPRSRPRAAPAAPVPAPPSPGPG